jgi:hypothetical protein
MRFLVTGEYVEVGSAVDADRQKTIFHPTRLKYRIANRCQIFPSMDKPTRSAITKPEYRL